MHLEAAVQRSKQVMSTPHKARPVARAGQYLLMEPLMLYGFEVHGVQGDNASCGIIKALHQIDNGRLAATAGTHQGNLAPWRYVQAHVLQDLNHTARAGLMPEFYTWPSRGVLDLCLHLPLKDVIF